MNKLVTSILVENHKIVRSRLLIFALLGILFGSFMIGFLMFISLHPEIANSSSIFSSKASLFTETTWYGYFSIILQMISALGLIIFGFLTSWIFGREYSDRTIKDLLALPISRPSVVLSKFIIISFWSLILSLVFFISSIVMGFVININNWSTEMVGKVFVIYIVTVIFTILVITPVALIASFGKGYLAPLAFIIATALIGQFINLGLPGLDPFVPWSIPVIFATNGILNQPSLPPLNLLSYIILICTFICGILGTMYIWNNNDLS